MRRLFHQDPDPLIMMFQEVLLFSILHIREVEWIQQNFYATSSIPLSLTPKIDGSVRWDFSSSSCLTLVSRRLPRPLATHVQFGTGSDIRLGRGVVVTDMPIQGPDGIAFLRLCNTHLSCGTQKASVRHGQLAGISSLLKGEALPPSAGSVIAGVVGGDMNFTAEIENEYDLDLTDAWDGTGDGNTWGYQSDPSVSLKLDFEGIKQRRLDRFLYTGSIEPLVGNTGTVQMIGNGLKAGSVAWELTKSRPGVRDRFVSKELYDKMCEQEGMDDSPLFRDYSLPAVRIQREKFVSDHYGITVRMKLR